MNCWPSQVSGRGAVAATGPCAEDPPFGGCTALAKALSCCLARLLGSELAIANAASHREVRWKSMFIKSKQNVPGQRKILSFLLYWHSQEQLMLGLDRADDTAVAHHLSSLDYCGCKSFGRFLPFFLLHRWQCPWSMTPLQASDCEAGSLRAFGSKTSLSIIWPLMFMDWCAVICTVLSDKDSLCWDLGLQTVLLLRGACACEGPSHLGV